MLNRLARLSRPGYILLKYKLQVVASFSTVNMEVGCHIVDSLGTSSCASPPAPPRLLQPQVRQKLQRQAWPCMGMSDHCNNCRVYPCLRWQRFTIGIELHSINVLINTYMYPTAEGTYNTQQPHLCVMCHAHKCHMCRTYTKGQPIGAKSTPCRILEQQKTGDVQSGYISGP